MEPTSVVSVGDYLEFTVLTAKLEALLAILLMVKTHLETKNIQTTGMVVGGE